MQDAVAGALREIVEALPPETWLEPDKLGETLRAKCGSAGGDASILVVTALKCSVPQRLLRCGGKMSSEDAEGLLITMQTQGRLPEQQASWAVIVWAEALHIPLELPSSGEAALPPQTTQAAQSHPPVTTTAYKSAFVNTQYVQDEQGQLLRIEGTPGGANTQLSSADAGHRSRTTQPSMEPREKLHFGLIKNWIALTMLLVGVSGAGLLIPRMQTRVAEITISAVVLCIAGLVLLAIRRCPACKATRIRVVSEALIHSRYLHPRKDGLADRRFSYNPLTGYYKVSRACDLCGHKWVEDVQRTIG
jgi:hypothetical protein